MRIEYEISNNIADRCLIVFNAANVNAKAKTIRLKEGIVG